MSITLPNPNLLPHQKEILKDKTRFKTLVWHRRARKTSTALEKLTLEAHNPYQKNKVYWLVFPTYSEAKEVVWKDPNMISRIIPDELIKKKHEWGMTIYFHSGSVLAIKGADKPDSLRGAGPYGVIFDEFDTMKPAAWDEVVQPILRANGGWAWFVGTPKGKKHLFRHFNHGRMGDDKEWNSWLLRSSASGIIPPDQLKAAKKTMSESLFNQEFECDFLEGEGTVFRRVRQIMTAKPQKPRKDRNYVMGVDLAKHQDYTVISVYDRKTNSQVYQDRFKTIEWPYQKSKIKSVAHHYSGRNKSALVVLDATGLGDPIADDLIREGISIKPFKISAQSKKELIEKMAIWIDQASIKLIPFEESLIEFEEFTYEIGPTGYVRYSAPIGRHDDIVMSNCLAVSELNPIRKKISKTKKLTRLQKRYQNLTGRRQDGPTKTEIEEREWFFS